MSKFNRDGGNGFNSMIWPFVAGRGIIESRDSELTRPLAHAAVLASQAVIFVLLLYLELALIGRGLPLAFGAYMILKFMFEFANNAERYAQAVIVATGLALVTAWFVFAPRVLDPLWPQVFYSVDLNPPSFHVYTNVFGARVYPLSLLWLRVMIILIVALILWPMFLIFYRFSMEIVVPGLSRMIPLAVDVSRWPLPPFNWFGEPTEFEHDTDERQIIMGPAESARDDESRVSASAIRNSAYRSWIRSIIDIGITLEDWIKLGKHVINGGGFSDKERLSHISQARWREWRSALAEAGWLANPTGRKYDVTDYGREQFEKLARGDTSMIEVETKR